MRTLLTGLMSLCLFSTSAFSKANTTDLEMELTSMIRIIQDEFYANEPFTVFDGIYTVVPKLIVSEDVSLNPNGNLEPVDENKMGVMVNTALLEIQDGNAILFALAHELGHAFSERLLTDIDCKGVQGSATEILADLGAMHVLHLKGLSLEDIEQTVRNWRFSNIFNAELSGDHPPGDERARLVVEAIEQLKNGESFKSVVRNLLENC